MFLIAYLFLSTFSLIKYRVRIERERGEKMRGFRRRGVGGRGREGEGGGDREGNEGRDRRRERVAGGGKERNDTKWC